MIWVRLVSVTTRSTVNGNQGVILFCSIQDIFYELGCQGCKSSACEDDEENLRWCLGGDSYIWSQAYLITPLQCRARMMITIRMEIEDVAEIEIEHFACFAQKLAPSKKIARFTTLRAT